jgi:hypothetical protein
MFKKFRTCNCLKIYKKYRVFRVAVCPCSIKDVRFLKVNWNVFMWNVELYPCGMGVRTS